MDRIIGKHVGDKPGPLLICIGGMHGNEPAGVKAIDLMLKMLEVEPITNPDFSFSGTFVGIIGNLKSYRINKRFIENDMNRLFTKEKVRDIMSSDEGDLQNEHYEVYELIKTIRQLIKEVKPSKMYVMDMHTTSSTGGIFTIATDDEESVTLAIELNVPVIKGLLDEITGTSLHYFNSSNFEVPTVTVTFESGQHLEQISVNRAIAAITNCMRSIGCVEADHVENRHDKILEDYSKDLPKVVKLLMRHEIHENDGFKMLPDYKNFQAVKKGELLANDKKGIIVADREGRLLMPLYQDQGDDGFFIVEIIEGY